jgi:hypothetical protein
MAKNLAVQEVFTISRKYVLNEDYIPKHLQYINNHEKPRTSIVLAENSWESHEVSMFIPQFIFNPLYGNWTTPNIPHTARAERQKITKNIYDDNFPLNKTIKYIYENGINYIIDRSQMGHRKFLENKNYFNLVYQDKEVNLFKIAVYKST